MSRTFPQPASPPSGPGAPDSPSGSGASRSLGADWGEHRHWDWQGQRCHWRVHGNSDHPALVLVHGFGAGSGHWRNNAGPLAAAGWCVYAVDLIGFGASSQPALRLDNRLWARQLQAFLEEVVQDSAVLVGHSLGGLVALSCSVFFPGSVRAVVAAPLPDPALLMASPHAPDRAPPRPPWRRRLKRWGVVLLCRLLPLEVIVPLLAHSPLLDLGIQAAYHEPVIGDGELHRVIARPARRPGAVRALRAMSIAMAQRPHAATAPSLLGRLRSPLLLIWGRQDRLVPLDVARQCRRLRGDLPLVVIDHAGHCPHDESPAAFNDLLLQWLAQLGSDDHDGPRRVPLVDPNAGVGRRFPPVP